MKIILYIIIVIAVIGILALWYETYIIGQYYLNAGLLLALIVGLAPALLIYIAYQLFINIKND